MNRPLFAGRRSRAVRTAAALLCAALPGTALLTPSPAVAQGAQVQSAAPSQTAPAAATALAPAEAAARALIEQMVQAHKSLNSYSATLELNAPANAAGTTRTVRSTVLLRRPSQARIITTDPDTKAVTTVVLNGQNLFVTSSTDPKTYQKMALPAGARALAQAFAPASGATVGLLPLLASGMPASQVVPAQATSLSVGPDDTVDGVPVSTVSFALSAGEAKQTMTLAVGKNDHLLRRLTILGNDNGRAVHVTETHTNVKANPQTTAAQFAFTPPPGAKVAEAPAEPAMFDPRLKVGAAPLAFSGTDLGGKPVTLEQYKGKVVLIDFWATWCGPCVAELPNVVAAYNKYKSKGFDVVGVSLDRAGEREKLVAFTKSHAMPWRQIYDGKYWQAAQAQRYGVQAIPFTLLIGRDGRIAAVGARGEELEPAIKAALAKK